MKYTKMFMSITICLLILGTSQAFAGRRDFEAENLRGSLSQRLDDAEGELDKARGSLETRSQELLDLIDKEVDEGFVKLDRFRKDLEGQVDALREELGEVLNDEQLQKLRDFLENLDEDVIASIQEELIAKLEEQLGVTSEQVEQLTPILNEALKKRVELLERYFNQRPLNFEDFNKDNDALWQESRSRLEEILSAEQIQELDAWRDEQRKRIRQAFADREAEESN